MRKSSVVIFVLSIFLCSCSQKNSYISELSSNWKLFSDSISIPATIPGSIQLNLLQNSIIPDPFYASNEEKIEWIEEYNWTYSTNFHIDKSFNHHDLILEGLDTYTTVFVNGKQVGKPNNMFRQWEYDLKGLTREGLNMLEIRFEPTQNITDSLYQIPQQKLPYDSRVMSRKAPYQFGWDWGPRIISTGIYKPVKIRSWNEFYLKDLQYYQKEIEDSQASLEARFIIESDKAQSCHIRIFNEESGERLISRKMELIEGDNILHAEFRIENPELWWPNGMGNQFLYTLKSEIECDNHIETDVKKIGIRKVKLKTKKDEFGEAFWFEINGRPVFMKGANWVPADNFPERISNEKYEQLICDAAKANFNMLRVWGGGIYEDDAFYEFCDQYGILVWQDFMFACALYPGNEAFLKNVKVEAMQQIKRIRNHASVALWCGNNEIDEAWHNWGIQKQFGYNASDSSKVWNDYQKLFHQLLPNMVDSLDGDRRYWSSSPRFGWGKPQSLTHGDMHYWGVWWGEEPFEKYIEKTGRFMSEFGFQGMPSVSSMKKFIPKDEMHLGSEAIKTHQKHPKGAELIQKYMERDFPVPANFEDYVYVSNLLQAYGIGMGIEAHRRAKPYCMGTLYWQYNDCWPVTSWAGIDYYGNWKALHYEVKDLYETVLISPLFSNDTLNVFIVSDSVNAIDANLNMEILDFKGNQILNVQKNIHVAENSSQSIYSQVMNLKEFRKEKCVAKIWIEKEEKCISERIFFFDRPKHLELPDAEVEINIRKSGCNYVLNLKSDFLIKDFYIEAKGTNGFFSENYFDILPGEVKTVVFTPKDEVNVKPDFEYRSLNKIVHAK